jgi:soluble lytic murein transglycosylase
MVANAPQFKRLHFFGKYGLAEGEWEALDLLEKLQKDPAHEAIYQAIAETGFAHTALQFALAHGWGIAANGDKTLALRRLELPRAYWSEVTQLAKQTGVDPYLILAIAKQESTFRATVVSHAGASGVMQLMPKTAQWLQSKDPDIPAGASNNLKCPINSISLGANYIEQMIDRSGGNLIYAVASYNGGPGNVDKWRKQFPTDNLDAFIDSIPYEETKDYVRKVLGYYMGYRSLYPDAGV